MNKEGSRIDFTPLPDRCLCVVNVWHDRDFVLSHRKTKKNLVRGYPYELNLRLDEPIFRKNVMYEYRYSQYPTLKGERVYIFLKGCFLGGMSEDEFTRKFEVKT